MGRSPCCEKAHTNKGAWTKEEDERLISYIEAHGEGCWRSLPNAAGLLRYGKSYRLRWINYLRPDLKRGHFTPEEDELIINLHGLLGNNMAPAEVKRECDDYDIPNEADDIRLINEIRVEPYHDCEAGPSNEEATNMNVEDGGADVKKEMVDDAHRNDMVGDVERAILEQKFDSVEDGCHDPNRPL
ncbi:unnamed protein product [Camellia sinensis]